MIKYDFSLQVDKEQRDIIHEYQKELFINFQSKIKENIKISTLNIIKYKSIYPYHEGILFNFLNSKIIDKILFKIKENEIFFIKGIKISSLDLTLENVKIILNKILEKLILYHDECNFIHNELIPENILILKGKVFFIRCHNSYFEYFGETFGIKSKPINDFYQLILNLYIISKNKDSKQYLLSIFEKYVRIILKI